MSSSSGETNSGRACRFSCARGRGGGAHRRAPARRRRRSALGSLARRREGFSLDAGRPPRRALRGGAHAGAPDREPARGAGARRRELRHGADARVRGATPAVASDIEGYAAVATPESAVLVPPGDRDALAGRSSSCSRTSRAARLGEGARKVAERYSWEPIARRLLSIYEELASQGVRSGPPPDASRFRAQRWGRLRLVRRARGARRARHLARARVVADRDAFRAVSWSWVVVAVGINLISVVVRSSAWRVVIHQAIPPPGRRGGASSSRPSASGSSGTRRCRASRRARPRGGHHAAPAPAPGTWATIVGTVFAHRLFDVVASRGPRRLRPLHGAHPELGQARAGDRDRRRAGAPPRGLPPRAAPPPAAREEELGAIRRVLRMARHGLTVLRGRPAPPLWRSSSSCSAGRRSSSPFGPAILAFQIDLGLARGGAHPPAHERRHGLPVLAGQRRPPPGGDRLRAPSYGVAYAHGFAFGIGLQAIEASVGVGLGLVFLAREGFSFAMLRRMPEVTEVDVEEDERVERIA